MPETARPPMSRGSLDASTARSSRRPDAWTRRPAAALRRATGRRRGGRPGADRVPPCLRSAHTTAPIFERRSGQNRRNEARGRVCHCRDLELMQRYVKAAGPSQAPFEGKLLVSTVELLATGGEIVHLEGAFKPTRVVFIEFPSVERAQTSYRSNTYSGDRQPATGGLGGQRVHRRRGLASRSRRVWPRAWRPRNAIAGHCLGYLRGCQAFGRQRVCPLVKGEVETPSDYDGVAYIDLDDAGGRKTRLVRELKAVGFIIDANRVFQT